VSVHPPLNSAPQPRILILGGDADFNLGDTAILHAICQCLYAANPKVQISLTSKLRDTLLLPGVVRVIHRGLLGLTAYLGAARHQDLLIIGGGGLFQDDDSRLKMPYWGLIVGSLRLLNNNMAALSLGAGPLRHWESRPLARWICRSLKSVSVRDQFARGWLEPCVGHPVDLVPDPAFMLSPALPEAGRHLIESTGLSVARPIVGVALRRWFHALGGVVPHLLRARAGFGRDAGRRELDSLLDQIASALQDIAGTMGAQVLLMPTYNVSHEADEIVCQRLAARLPTLDVRLARISDPALYKSVAGHLRLMISARMHPLILAASMNVPIVGLAYNGKFEGLFDLLGIPRRLVWMNESRNQPVQARIVALAAEALRDNTDVRARTQQLGGIVRQRAVELLHVAEERAARRA
jgi:polysaccharide pyruvyl transferase WcaK-like protein